MLTRRLLQLLAGLVLYGASLSMMVRSDLGLAPWDVFHQGLSQRLGWSFGTVLIAVSACVLLLWIPLRQKPGVGTVANALLVGVVADATLAVLPPVTGLPLRITLLAAGIVINGVATATYIGARLGPGARDGLMTGVVARFGGSVRLVRTGIELSVLAAGWILGGTVGLGTLVYALAIGPLAHHLLPLLTVPEAASRARGRSPQERPNPNITAG